MASPYSQTTKGKTNPEKTPKSCRKNCTETLIKPPINHNLNIEDDINVANFQTLQEAFIPSYSFLSYNICLKAFKK